MKVFLSILLYLICSECRIDEAPSEQISFTVMASGRTEYQDPVATPIVIRSLGDYTSFYQNYYGTYPGYFDFDFTQNMIVVFFKNFPNGSYNLDIDHITESADRLIINMAEQPRGVMSTQAISPRYMMLSLKTSDKDVVVY